MAGSNPNFQPAESTGESISGYIGSAERVLSAIEGLGAIAAKINEATEVAVVAIATAQNKAVAIAQKEILLKQGEAVADVESKKVSAAKAVLIEKGEALTAIKNAKESAVQAIVTVQSGYSLGKADSPELAKPEDKGYKNS